MGVIHLRRERYVHHSAGMPTKNDLAALGKRPVMGTIRGMSSALGHRARS